MPMKSRTISARIYMSFGSVLFVLAASGLIGFTTQTRLNTESRSLSQTSGVLRRLSSEIAHQVRIMGIELTSFIYSGSKEHKEAKFEADDLAHAAMDRADKLSAKLSNGDKIVSALGTIREVHDSECEPSELKMLD